MEKTYFWKDYRLDLKYKISSLAFHGDFLIVGTISGSFYIYQRRSDYFEFMKDIWIEELMSPITSLEPFRKTVEGVEV